MPFSCSKLQRFKLIDDAQSRCLLQPLLNIASGSIRRRRSRIQGRHPYLHAIRYFPAVAGHWNFADDELQYAPRRKTSRR
jgi:hypothetical protein